MSDAERQPRERAISNSEEWLVKSLTETLDEARNALLHIAGYDIAGYDAHLRPEEVARAALAAMGIRR